MYISECSWLVNLFCVKMVGTTVLHNYLGWIVPCTVAAEEKREAVWHFVFNEL